MKLQEFKLMRKMKKNISRFKLSTFEWIGVISIYIISTINVSFIAHQLYNVIFITQNFISAVLLVPILCILLLSIYSTILYQFGRRNIYKLVGLLGVFSSIVGGLIILFSERFKNTNNQYRKNLKIFFVSLYALLFLLIIQVLTYTNPAIYFEKNTRMVYNSCLIPSYSLNDSLAAENSVLLNEIRVQINCYSTGFDGPVIYIDNINIYTNSSNDLVNASVYIYHGINVDASFRNDININTSSQKAMYWVAINTSARIKYEGESYNYLIVSERNSRSPRFGGGDYIHDSDEYYLIYGDILTKIEEIFQSEFNISLRTINLNQSQNIQRVENIRNSSLILILIPLLTIFYTGFNYIQLKVKKDNFD